MNITGLKKRMTLVHLVARIFWGFFLIISLALFIYNYQFNREIVSHELKRSLGQTGESIQQQVATRLEIFRLQQDSTALSQKLLELIERQETTQLDVHFSALDYLDGRNGPSFKFIYSYGDVIWEDGSAKIFDVTNKDLQTLATKVSFVNNWHFTKHTLSNVDHHILLRRSPLVSTDTGEVFGHYIIAIVLDNNFDLIRVLSEHSQVSAIGLKVGDDIIAQSTLSNDATTKEDFRQYIQSQNPKYVETLPILLHGTESPIKVTFSKNSKSIEQLTFNFRFSLIFVFILVSAITLMLTNWLKRKMELELEKVMLLTTIERKDLIGKNAAHTQFEGSNIAELDRIGRSLESKISEIQSKEKTFRDFFNFSVSPTLVWDSKSNIVEANPNAINAFQLTDTYTKATLTHKLESYLGQAQEGATLSGLDIDFSGSIYRWSFSNIEFESGLQGVIAQAIDITSLIEAREQSKKAQVIAENAAQARAEFIAKVSHEIRTPLNGILGITQLLKNETAQKRVEKVDVLHQSGEHLLAVLNDILDFSKIDQGKVEVEKSSFSLLQLVNTVEAFYASTCEEKKIELTVNTNNSDHLIVSDQVRLTQIILNLMNNAIKFTEKGSVTLDVSLSFYSFDSANLIVSVVDTGIGVSEQYLENIFEPFTQESSNTGHKYGGTGLGLSIVKSLVDLFDGSIKVSSQEDKGASFTINIPVSIEEKTTFDSIKISEFLNRYYGAFQILLVEDNKTNAYIIKALCKDYPVKIAWVNSAEDAIEKIQTKKFDLVLMDNQMPNMSGLEATHYIRQELNIETPIYACTANGYHETVSQFMAAGADYILIKPIQEKLLQDAFTHYIQNNNQTTFL